MALPYKSIVIIYCSIFLRRIDAFLEQAATKLAEGDVKGAIELFQYFFSRIKKLWI